MKLENTVKTFNEIHPDNMILIKVGTFFQAFGKDAYILSYLLGYKLNPILPNYSSCGFPKTGLSKVLAKLEEMEISYIVLDKADNYNEIEKEEFKNKNQYKKVLRKASEYIVRKRRIDEINQYLINNILKKDTKEKINKIEEILYNKN